MDTRAPLFVDLFELLGAYATEMTVTTRAIVERDDVVGCLRYLRCNACTQLDAWQEGSHA
jgi:hypothetical protein